MASTRPLGEQTLRGFGLFQIIAAVPTMVILGICAVEELIWPWGRFYFFFAPVMTAIMAAGIVFIVYIQRKAVATPYRTLCFEGAKAILATGLWLWLILDSAFGPWKNEYYNHDPPYTNPDLVTRRVQRDAFAVIVLLVFFYPPLGYAYVVWRTRSSHGDVTDSDEGGEEGFVPTERASLLPRQSRRSFG